MFEDFKNYMTDVYNKRRSFESVPVDRIFSFYDKDKYSIFSKYVNRAVVLDFGCGNLTLPVAVQETTALYDTYDIDTSNGAAMFHKLSDIPGRYDVIIMFHVCEHYPNFDALYNDLLWIRDHCRTLIICVPNHSGVYDSMGEDMTHKLIINTTDFMCLLDKAGFAVDKKILSSISKGLTPVQHIRYFIRAGLVFALMQSPFFNYTLICKPK